jgi:hypothetical protein
MNEKSDVTIDLDRILAAIARSTQFQKAVVQVAEEVRDEAAAIARVVAYDEGYYADSFEVGTDQAQKIQRRYVDKKVRRNKAVYGRNRYIDAQVKGNGLYDKYNGIVGIVANLDWKAIWVEYGSIAKGPRRVMLTAAERIGKKYRIEVEPVYDNFHDQNTDELAKRISKGRGRNK